MHARFCAHGGGEVALVGEEAVADHGDTVDHCLGAIGGPGFRHVGHVERDECCDPEVDYDVIAGRWGSDSATPCTTAEAAEAAFHVVGTGATVGHECAGAATRYVVEAVSGAVVGACAGFGDAAFDACAVVWAGASYRETWMLVREGWQL